MEPHHIKQSGAGQISHGELIGKLIDLEVVGYISIHPTFCYMEDDMKQEMRSKLANLPEGKQVQYYKRAVQKQLARCLESTVHPERRKGNLGFIGYFSKKKDEEADSEMDEVEQIPDTSTEAIDPLRRMMAKDDLAAVLRGIEALSPLERRIILGVYSGLTFRDIAQREHLSKSVVCERVALIRKLLRKIIM